MKIGENKVVTLEYKVYDADTKELLEDTRIYRLYTRQRA